MNLVWPRINYSKCRAILARRYAFHSVRTDLPNDGVDDDVAGDGLWLRGRGAPSVTWHLACSIEGQLRSALLCGRHHAHLHDGRSTTPPARLSLKRLSFTRLIGFFFG